MDMYTVAKTDGIVGIDMDEFRAVLSNKGYFTGIEAE